MRNLFNIIAVVMVALLGLANASLGNIGNLTSYDTPELQGNNLDGNTTMSNATQPLINCYSTGAEWASLGNWQDVFDALQISGVMRVSDIPAGYHISDKVPVGTHCYVYEVGINKGHAYPTKEDYNKGLEMVYNCAHGGKQTVNFVAPDGGIIAQGWVKGDPQDNSDCS